MFQLGRRRFNCRTQNCLPTKMGEFALYGVQMERCQATSASTTMPSLFNRIVNLGNDHSVVTKVSTMYASPTFQDPPNKRPTG
jgi:hypothetical protein